MSRLHVIVASTRPGRVGLPVAKWFEEAAQRNGKFEVRLVDLAEFNLPVFDEPAHPRTQEYEHEHTKKWAAAVDEADAFVIVTPEYNFSAPPALVNALDYLYNEWNYKPVGLVSYGGTSGGLRSVQMTKQLVTTLKMVPMVEAVSIPLVWNFLNEQGEFVADDRAEGAATEMLNELVRWTEALAVLRTRRD